MILIASNFFGFSKTSSKKKLADSTKSSYYSGPADRKQGLRLCLQRRLVVRSIREVDQLLGFLEREPGCAYAARGLAAGIRRGGRIPSSQLLGERTVRDHSRPPAVADAGELAVPLLEWQPDFEDYL